MDKILTKQIRNICLIGHGGSGKTSLAEAMLYLSHASDRLGKPSEGNTVCDYDPEEIKRGFSLQGALAPVMWKDIKINIIDTPGYLDFVGEELQGIRVADNALICIDGKSGVEVGAQLAWDYATEAGIPKSFFINKFDDPEARFARVFGQLKDAFGVSVCPIIIPMIEGNAVIGFLNLVDMKAYVYDKTGAHSEGSIPEEFMPVANEYRDILYESIAQTSDELMEKYFGGEEITRDEAMEAIHQGIIDGTIAPVICGSALKMWGVETLLDVIAESYPRHTAKKVEMSADGEEIAIAADDTTTSLFVFKTVADPFVGKMSYFKVMTGELNNTMTLRNTTTGAQEKMAKIYTIRGKKQTEVDTLCCGDIGVIAKLNATNTCDTLTTSAEDIKYAPIAYPEPFMKMAVVPKAKGDEDKISSGITKLLEEDRTLRFENNAETKQLCISGLGDIHLDVVVSKLKSRYGTSVDLVKPKIAYRETIKKTVQAEGKHKKQSGGHGQYGHVKITFKPGEAEGLTFTESVVGGSVPKGFFPAVEKGLIEAMQKGVLAGFPVVNLAADLYDGSYHDVDSSEMAFKLAASLAYKDGLAKANPVILEPIGELKAVVPDSLVGDVIGDVNKRRGRVLGMNAIPNKKGYQMVEAEVPISEMTDYTISLRAMSQGRGSFTFYFTRYEEAPAPVAQKIIAEAQKDED
ncbi:MAG: elongation factor G [Clostridia bacterium]|nr:elongation factor G [Clostridia bacterium]